MIQNTFVKRIAAGILRNHKMTVVERNIMHPERDWLIGIFVGAIIVTIAGIWSLNTYIQFKNVSFSSAIESPESIIYKENLVNSALVDFEKRKEAYELLKQELINKKQVATVAVEPVEAVTEIVIDEANTEVGVEPVVEEGEGEEVIRVEL